MDDNSSIQGYLPQSYKEQNAADHSDCMCLQERGEQSHNMKESLW